MATHKILMVDDDEDLHILYKLYLQGEAFEVLEAFDGAEALELLETQRPDLIILDMIMPKMDGEEFLMKLRSDKRFASMPVVIATVNEKIPPKLLDIGRPQGFLRKPFSMDELLTLIRQALSIPSK